MDYMEQVTRIRYKTEDNPPMANVPLIGYSKKAIRTQSSRVASCVEASKME